MIRFKRFRPEYLFLPLLSVWLLVSCGTKQFSMTDRGHAQYEINGAIEADPKIVRFYTPYKVRIDQEMNQVIGQTAVPLTRSLEGGESVMSNFFADALLYEGCQHDPGVDFSFGTNGGLRCDLPQGNLTVRHLYELMPFENHLVILELSGAQVRQLAQFVAGSGGQPIAGMQIQIRGGKPTAIHIDGKAIASDNTYKLVTYDYLANGGDQVPGLENPLSRTDLSQNVREALIDYIKETTTAQQPLNPKLDGRIRIN